MFNYIKQKIKLRIFQKKWRKLNSHNKTVITRLVPISLIEIGDATYGDITVLTWNNKARLRIGGYCSIAPETTFLLDAEHYTTHISTYPFKRQLLGVDESFARGDIVIEDDVWIGYRSTIMSGVHIGQGAIIAAGAIVTKDIPPYAIAAGIPAKVVKYRFNDEVISKLVNVSISNISSRITRDNVDSIYKTIEDEKDLDEILKCYQ